MGPRPTESEVMLAHSDAPATVQSTLSDLSTQRGRHLTKEHVPNCQT